MNRHATDALRPRIAVLEANRFHEEVLFAFVAAASRLPHGAEVTVFAPNHWEAMEFMRDDLRLECAWRPFDEFGSPSGPDSSFDLIVANTFPSPAGQSALDRALDRGLPVLGLVHDIDFFNRYDGAEAALARWPTLILGHAGVIPPRPLIEFDAALRERLVRFIPVIPIGSETSPVDARTGIALPGALEFARRDISTALRLAAKAGLLLRIFGRSKEKGDGPRLPRDLDADRERLHREIDGMEASTVVDVATDVSCRRFYRAVEQSRFVAVVPVHPDYLRGKLTGAVTAAISCRVPMIASPDVHQHYTMSDPVTFAACMLRFDPEAPAGEGSAWATVTRDMAPDVYWALCQATAKAREQLLSENTSTLEYALSMPRVSG